MRIVHVIVDLVQTSGVSVTVREVAERQARMGHDVWIAIRQDPDTPIAPEVHVKEVSSLSELGFAPDLVHVHGIWTTFSAKAMRWCRRRNVRYIVSPHGGLMSRVFIKGWWKKVPFYVCCLWDNLRNADMLHCTGNLEMGAVTALGLKPPMVYAPLGCNMPAETGKLPKPGHELLFLSRIGEEKGLGYLLDAWKELDHGDWTLNIAGPGWRGYVELVKYKIAREKIKDVVLSGGVKPDRVADVYRKADGFVLSSPVENFSLVVLDALAFGLPVVCTQGVPWGEIAERNSGWWVTPSSSEALKAAIGQLLAMTDAERLEMGARGRALAQEKYTWDVAVRRLNEQIGVA